MRKKTFIIVGQGIAGTVLAAVLLEKGCSVRIINEPGLSNASRIAPGLYNPVVFKRLIKSWMADELIAEMQRFYPWAEQKLNKRFYHKKKIIKLFAESQEIELWKKRAADEVGKYLCGIQEEFLPGLVHAPLGAAEVCEAGNLDTTTFLNAFREYYMHMGILSQEKFDPSSLHISENGLHYKELEADRLIFCEGYKALENPWFSWLPFKLTKGELITIRLEEGVIPAEKVINKGVFILPMGNDLYKVGSTYEWENLHELVTEKGKKELCEKLDLLLKVKYTVLDHQGGIRPTVQDRRPLIGMHPRIPSLGVFNGMGTKAVMLVPYFAGQFADHLISGASLNKEADIARFGYL